jgi:hypothetical protein
VTDPPSTNAPGESLPVRMHCLDDRSVSGSIMHAVSLGQ